MLQLQQFISLGVLVLALSAKSVAGRAFGIGEEEDVFAQPHTAIDLNSTNFDQYLGQLPPQQWCLIEFYAAWCPHCRHYAPVFEKISNFMKGLASQGGPAVFVGRMDCAKEVQLCSDFKVPSYPHVTAGLAQVYISRGNISHHKESSAREPPDIIKWMGGLMNLNLTYSEAPAPAGVAASTQNTTTLASPSKGWHGLVWHVRDVEGATILLWDMITATPHLTQGADKRKALTQLVHWWASSHVSDRCAAGAQRLLALLPALWPEAQPSPQPELEDFKICGAEAEPFVDQPSSWVTCRGSTPGSRGFTCGLWLLFHTGAARLPEEEEVADSKAADAIPPAQIMILGLRAFANHFFLCEVCQQHFSKIVNNPELDKLKTRKEAIIWLWKTHNQVNARLGEEERRTGTSSSGDPAFPKIQWPSVALCSGCRQGTPGKGQEEGGWDEEAVYKYLVSVYGATPTPSPVSSSDATVTDSASRVSSGSDTKTVSQQKDGAEEAAGNKGGSAPKDSSSKSDVQQEQQGAQLVLGGAGEGGEGGPSSPRSLWVLWISLGLTWTAVIAASLSLAYYVLSVKRRGVTGNGSTYGMNPWQLLGPTSTGAGGGWRPPSPKAGVGWQMGFRTNGSGPALAGSSGEVQAGSHASRRSWG